MVLWRRTFPPSTSCSATPRADGFISVDPSALVTRPAKAAKKKRIEFDDGGVASIRRIYANLTRLAAQRGFPRRDAETPYEFIRGLRAAFPDAEFEERAITDAYVRVHYGEHDPTAEELQQVRVAWERIRAVNSER